MTTDEIMDKIVEAKIFDDVKTIASIELALKMQDAHNQIFNEALGIVRHKSGEFENKFGLRYQVAQKFGGLYKGE